MNKKFKLGWKHIVTMTLSHMQYRKWYFVLTLLIIATPITFIFVLSSYSFGYIKHLKTNMTNMPTRIELTTGNPSNNESRFSPEKIDEIKSLPNVIDAFPYYKQFVYVLLNKSKSRNLELRGTKPDDPGVKESQLIWGRSVMDISAHEIIFPERVFASLGGDINNGPFEATLILKRTINKYPQTKKIKLRVVGIVNSNLPHVAYVPYKLLEKIGFWTDRILNDVDINKHATLEQRYQDINYRKIHVM